MVPVNDYPLHYPRHYGGAPQPGAGGRGGPEAMHAQLHEALVGKTIVSVYFGDGEPLTKGGEASSGGAYVIFEFADGSMVKLSADAGSSFLLGTEVDARSTIHNSMKPIPSIGFRTGT